MLDVDLSVFEAARVYLGEQGLSTPLLPFHARRAPQGNEIWLKAESLQPSGSFKIRGVTYRLSRLSEEEKRVGVVAYSTGNHSQAVALAALTMGVKATIVMTSKAQGFKVQATKDLGAHVIMALEPTTQAMREMAEALAKAEGYTLIAPYDDPDVIVGQGTIGVEILEALDPEAIFVPIGGGGLIAGIAMAVKKKNPKVKIIGVEAEMENDAYQSFQTGEHIGLKGPSESLADAIKIQSLGEITYPIVCKYVDEIVQVDEEEIAAATLLHLSKGHLMVEPSGALALAAVLSYKKSYAGNKPIVCIASGGNFLLSSLCQLLQKEHYHESS